MILTFSEKGNGGGKGPVRYVCGDIDHKGTQRSEAPEVLCGDPATTEKIIDSSPNKWKYTSAVISFTKEEFTPKLAKKVLDDFIEAAYPGLERHRFDVLAVLHTDTPNPHIHVIAPRLELTTGKDLNIAPPGSQRGFWRDWSALTRAKHGLAQVDTRELDALPLNKRERRALCKVDIERMPHTQAKLLIDRHVRENIANGLIQNRNDIITYFKGMGLEIGRITPSAISIKTNTRNIRFTGGIYEQRDRNTFGEILSQPKADKHENRAIDAGEFKRIEQRFNFSLSKILNRNVKEYCGGKSKNREEYKAFFLSLKKTTSNLRSGFAGTQHSHKRNEFDGLERNSPSRTPVAKSSAVARGDDLSQIMTLVAQLNATTDPMEKLEINAQIDSIKRRSPRI